MTQPLTNTPDQFALEKNLITPENKERVWNLTFKYLTEVHSRINKVLDYYMDLDFDQRELVSLWIIGTWFHKEFPTYPRLFVNAMKGSGKSRLMGILKALCYNGVLQTNLTEAVLFRTASDHTILFDECEALSGKDKGALRELLNSGYKRGSVVKRMKKVKIGGNEEQVVDTYDIYSPVAFANIYGLENVLNDRAITIILEKSDNQKKINLVENFENNVYLLDIKRTLKAIRCSFCNVCSEKRYIEKTNIYLNSSYYTELSNTIHNIHNNNINIYTQTSNDTSNNSNLMLLSPIMPIPEIEKNRDILQNLHNNQLTDEDLFFYNKIMSLNINGRNMELFLPLFIIAHNLEGLQFENFTEVARRYVNKKKKDELFENKDIALIEFISKREEGLTYIPIKQITEEFRQFYLDDDSNQSFITSFWIGRALKRLGLIIDKKRRGHGYDVILNTSKARDKMMMFKFSDERGKDI